MINKNTLFILGAGASWPFGYPLGVELREKICKSSINKIVAQALAQNEHELREYEGDVFNFRRAFFESATPSIDVFLEHRQQFMSIGKMAIAQVLISQENEKNLFETKSVANWYMYLWNRMNVDFNNFNSNKVSFITFNYDRSLEHFLFTALKNKYNKSDNECVTKIKNIPIIHLYGQIDFLPWQDNGGISYGSRTNIIMRLRSSERNIKILHESEQLPENEYFQEAYKLISEAESIFFLGFGFDQVNLERLINIPLTGKAVYGTAFGLERTMCNLVKEYFRKECNTDILLVDKDNLDLLKEYLPL